MNRNFILVALGLAAVAALLLALLGPEQGDARAQALAACRGDQDGAAAERFGAEIGGEFTLIDQDGAQMTAAALIDRPTLIYFGYTFCPDFCPTDVANMALAAEMLETRGVDARTAFVTIDPQRDTAEMIRGFVRAHHPDMIGLTGSEAAIAQAARAWRVYYARADDDPDLYLMDHSTYTYLMVPGLGMVDFFRHATPPETIAERTACHVRALARS